MTTRQPGVYPTEKGKWLAYASVRGKARYVGSYASEEKAKEALCRFEVEGEVRASAVAMESIGLEDGTGRVKVDREDFKKVAGMKWRVVDGVVLAIVDGVVITMGQALFGEGGKIEFRNGDWLDYRKENILLRGYGKKMGLKGVSKHVNSTKNQIRYVARVHVGGRTYTLGYADTPEEAHQIYLAKADKKRAEVIRLGRVCNV